LPPISLLTLLSLPSLYLATNLSTWPSVSIEPPIALLSHLATGVVLLTRLTFSNILVFVFFIFYVGLQVPEVGVLPGVPARGADGGCEHGNRLHQSDSAPQMPRELIIKRLLVLLSSAEICSWHPTITYVQSYPNSRLGIF
jgi:hypothetical protein